jgi:deoxyribose-phosphate aldolase
MDLKKSPESIAKIIDHTNLKPDAATKDIEKLCEEAKKYGFASVCVNPSYVSFSKNLLEDTNIKVCTVIGFPLGANTSKIKFFETTDAVRNGADEIDMVINIGALKSGLDDKIKNDIAGVVAAAEGRIVKVIIETGLLNKYEKLRACKASKEAGANFVKTSTGFGVSGATVEDIKLLKENIGSNMGIKASGGIRNLKTALNMVDVGVARIGTSSGVQIMEELLTNR